MKTFIILQVTDDQAVLSGIVLGAPITLVVGSDNIPCKFISVPKFLEEPFPTQDVTITGTIAPA